MSKILTFITILILSTFTMFAEERSEQQMREAAQRAITQNLPDRSRARSAGNDLKELMAMPKLKIYGYDDGGFAVVTSDDRFDEVIGYSSTTFAKEMPCGFKWWLNTVNEVMEKAKGSSPVSAKSRAKIKKASVAPILKTKWGQGNPFNSLLHYNVRGTDVEFVTGCVATAMAQVMKHYEYPDCGRDSITYVIWKYWSNMKHTFGDTFDWANMLDEYTYQIWGYLPPDAKAVATLMRDCGMAVKMQYGPKESGANTEEIAPALINYFQYD